MFIKPNELNDKLEELTVIDIRSESDVLGKGMVPTAINVFKEELLKDPSKYLNKESKYVLYCNGGNSASIITKILQADGYDVMSLEGGHRAWKEFADE